MSRMNKNLIGILFLFLPLYGGANHPELEWLTLESDHFLVHFHNGTERTAKEVVNIAEFIYTPATELYNYQPKQKTHIIIKDTDDFSNGSAFFFDNKIEIWANPLDFDLRGSHNWIQNVITHEFIHIIQLGASLKHDRHFPAMYIQSMNYEDEKRKDVLYGYPNSIISYAIPSIVIPPWFAEGVAQRMFNNANYDFWDTHRDMILRDAFINNNVFTLNQLNSFGKTGIGNEQIYNQGYSLAEYFTERFGYSILKSISKNISHPLQYSFGGAIKQTTGLSMEDIYSSWYEEMSLKYKSKNNKYKLREKILIDEGSTNIHPVWSPFNEEFAYLSNAKKDYFGQTDLYIYNFSDSTTKKIDSGVFSCPVWVNDSTIIYSKKSKPNKHGSKFYDLYLTSTNKKKNKPKRLTVDMRLTSPSINKEINKIAAIGISDGTSNIFEANLDLNSLDNIKFKKVTNYSNGEKIFSLSYNSNDIVFDLLIKNHGRDIYVLDSTKEQTTPLKEDIWDERDPHSDNNKIVYSSDMNGVYNIYLMYNGETLSISDVVGGAFMPSISKDKVLYSLYENEKYKIVLLNISPNDFVENQLKANYDAYTYHSTAPIVKDIKSKDYSQELSMPFIFPRILFDYGTVKPGFYFYASDPLNKYFLFGGASKNNIDDLDIFLLFELNRYYPTLYANFYWVTRNLDREDNPTSVNGQVYDNIKFTSNDTYMMFSADLGAKMFYKGHNFTYNYNYSKYTAHSFGLTQILHNNEVQNSYPFDLTYDYFRGHKFTLGYDLKKYSYRYAFNMIPQNGYEINTNFSLEMNQFDPSFEVSEEYGTLSLVFSDHDTYRFNFNLKKNTTILKSRRIALNQNLQLGYLTNKEIDDFFYYFGGGLTGLRGYTFYDKKLSGTQLSLFTNTIRTPIFLEKSYKFLNLLIQNLSFNYILQAGVADMCNNDGCGDTIYSNGFELRVNGTSFYSFPFALSYEIHRPLFDIDQTNKHYIKLLFEFME